MFWKDFIVKIFQLHTCILHDYFEKLTIFFYSLLLKFSIEYNQVQSM